MRAVALVAAALFAMSAAAGRAATTPQEQIRHAVDDAVRPLMAKDGIAGMAVGITVNGRTYVFDFGIASKQPQRPVTDQTLFEVGSISKTFTATLASYAQLNGNLSLSDPVRNYLPELRGTAFGSVPLLDLGTHTAGGLPLQVPNAVQNDGDLMQYFKTWRPASPPGTSRTYTNVGIGTLGLITAKSMHADFATLMQTRLFSGLGLHHTYIDVPPSKMTDYAEGYRKDGAPVRMTPGELWQEAYGERSTAADMIRFVEANMNLIPIDAKLQRAITETHTAYYTAGALTQDLIWEQYRYPVALNRLQDGNSPAMLFDATPAQKLSPPEQPDANVWINKTGSTNGFGAYVAFIPAKRIGIVILANKSYPIADRVSTAFKILTVLSRYFV